MENPREVADTVVPRSASKRLPLLATVALIIVALVVGAVCAGLVTWNVMRNSDYYTAPEDMLICTQMGADDAVSLTFTKDGVRDAQSLTLKLIYNDMGEAGPRTILSRETTVEETSDEGRVYLVTSPTIMRGLETVEVILHRAEGDQILTLESPTPTAFSPNGPDCEPHVHRLSLKLGEELGVRESEEG